MRKVLLGLAAGFIGGYAAVRAWQAYGVREPIPRREKDAAAYGRTQRALAIASIARGMAGEAAMAFGPIADGIERAVQPLPGWLRPSAYTAVTALIDIPLALPADYIENYVLEHQYGLSEQSRASWLSDRAKAAMVGTGVASVLSGLLGGVLHRWPRAWQYIATAGAFPLLLLANVVAPIYILPLFNKYEPLTGPLEVRLRALAARFGVGDADILRVNMSKQTTKANAFVVGIGSTHRIVVGDTLADNFTPEEVEFVVAHELGHYVAKDTWRLIAAGQVMATMLVFATSLVRPKTPAQLLFWASVFSQAMRPAMCAFARSREWAADRFALETTRAPQTGVAAFRRLRDQNLAEDEQPDWYEFFFSTHPSLKDRIAALEAAR